MTASGDCAGSAEGQDRAGAEQSAEVAAAAALDITAAAAFDAAAIDPEAIVIGLDADMSSSAAEAGEAIRRGAILAIDEINGAGGVLGRKLALVVADHRGNPTRGVDNIEAFAGVPNLVAVMGGLHTPVALAELDAVHKHRLLFLIPWAAGTAIVDNNRAPNYVFRVSVRDEFAGRVMARHALAKGCKTLGLLLERTLWGRSNRRAITVALREHPETSMVLEWLSLGSTDLAPQVQSLVAAGADCVILVSNPLEGIAAIESMAQLERDKRRPIISHWGILGRGRTINERLRPHLEHIDLSIIQTFSFFNPRYPERAERVFGMYRDAFPGVKERRDVFSPTGTAHAYELIHLLALAIARAGTTDRPQVRDALESLDSYRGLIRDYTPPFTAQRHDALGEDDLQMCRVASDGSLRPVTADRGGSR